MFCQAHFELRLQIPGTESICGGRRKGNMNTQINAKLHEERPNFNIICEEDPKTLIGSEDKLDIFQTLPVRFDGRIVVWPSLFIFFGRDGVPDFID